MRPLEGFRVLDLADEKGELCGRLLADLGADVVRVESPAGAVSRGLPPFAPDGETSLYFAYRNAGKRGLRLDLTAETDRARLHELLDEVDVLIESGAPGELERLGLAPDELLAHHPALIVTSITDFGQTGPYRDYQGTDMIGFAMGGMMYRAGSIERPPVVAPGALAYDSTGVTAAFATLAACWKRLRTGRGQHLDVSVYESVANLSDWAMPNYSLMPNVGARAGTGIYSLYRCADGFVRMIILVKHHWRALLEWIGNPPELLDPTLDEFITRLQNQQLIEKALESFFRDKKKIDVAVAAQTRGIPATPLLTPAEVIANEHTQERGSFARLEVAAGVVADVPSGFLTVDGERAGPRTRPPTLGEHDAEPFPGGLEREDAAPSASLASTGGAPFEGLKVIDFGVGAAGVEVGRLLGDFGADVIKIESRHAPDFIRVIMGTLMNANFASSNRGKRSLGVNVKDPRGLELVQRLVSGCDVVIENNGSGVMERLGLDYATLSKLNPRVVMLSSQMVGSYGPWRDWIGYGPSTHAVSGLQYLWNYPEDKDRPAGSTNVYPDHFVGRLGAFAIVAGLIGRQRSGRGLHADAAQFEAAIGLLGDLFARESLEPGSVEPQGNASERGAPWGAYRCAGDDEWCVINVRSDAEWAALVEVLGSPTPAWARDPSLRQAAGRSERRAEIDRGIEAWTSERSPREVMESLQDRGVPAGMIQHARHHTEDPQLAARGYHQAVEQPEIGRILLEGPPFHGSDIPEPVASRAPKLGEHTREVARELGLSDAEIAALVEADVLEDPP